MSHKAVSKFVRVATEGPTVDGRAIPAQQIQQMADNYDPSKYQARIWIEHFRGLLVESQFPALGDVMALKAEKGSDGKLALFAQLAPNDKFFETNKRDQKVFTSIEIDPDFAGSGEAYMVGLAVTDTPASIGTERLMFRQQDKTNKGMNTLLMPAVEGEVLELTKDEDKPVIDNGPSLADRVSDLFSSNNGKTNQRLDGIEAGVMAMAKGIDDKFAALAEGLTNLKATPPKPDETTTTPADDVAALKKQVDDMAAQLASEPDPAKAKRPASTGADTFTKTDC